MVVLNVVPSLLVVLALLRLGAAQECGLVVVGQDQLKREIRSEVVAALTEYGPGGVPGGNGSPGLLPGSRNDSYTATLVNATVERAMEGVVGIIEDKINQALEPIQRECNTSTFEPVLREMQLLLSPGRSSCNPASSCREIKELDPSSPSGYYWIGTPSVSLVRVYCDMTRTCGGITGGWMRVTNIDMTNSSNTCPPGLRFLTIDSKRLCGMNINGAGCSSTTFTVHGIEYSRVCGKIIGYQQKTPDAFQPYIFGGQTTIDSYYVDGVSLTHGSHPRKHIWTFAAALHEVITSHRQFICPCTNINNPETIRIPPFVGNDYFCDTASSARHEFRFYPDDPLWDGSGCGPLNTCCSFNRPPWFMKQLPSPTTDNIEMRLCANYGRNDEDIPVEKIELYVQ